MKQIITLFTGLFISVFSFAQTYNWVIDAGSSGEDRAFGTTTDASGNIYTTGQFRNGAVFGNIIKTSAGVEDVYVVKQDNAGNILWVFGGGGPNPDIGYDIVTDNAGNTYVAGTYYDHATFGTVTLNSAGTADYDIFILKLNSQGVVQWAKSAGGSGYDVGRGIAISKNQLFLAGNIGGNAMFSNLSATSIGLNDIFVAGYTLNGAVSWVSVAGGLNYDIANGVCADTSGNAYLTGYFQSTATFGSSTIVNPSSLYTNVFTAKINAAGTFQWAKGGGNPSDDDIGRAIDCDAAGNVYTGGEYRGTAVFDNITVTCAGIADIFVAKYNTLGVIQYVSTEGGEGGDYCYSIAASSSKLYITGLFNGIVQFGTTVLTSAGNNDIFISELDAATGAYNWSQRAGGLGDDAGRAVAVNPNGFIAYAGDFEHNGSTFGPFTLNTMGSHDIFIAKITVSSCTAGTVSIQAAGPVTFCNGNFVTLNSTATNALNYQWKKNGAAIPGATNPAFTASATGSYTLSILDNCGNTITSNSISVTVNSLPKAQITPAGMVNICAGDVLVLTANTGNGLSYQWMKNNTILSGQTSSTLSVTTPGSYKVVVTKNSTGCAKISKVTKVKVTCKQSIADDFVSIYPNPSATGFSLNGVEEELSVQVVNLSGQVLSESIINGKESFGRELPAGIYFARITFTDGIVQVIKIVKQ